jgi:hypothetical protein
MTSEKTQRGNSSNACAPGMRKDQTSFAVDNGQDYVRTGLMPGEDGPVTLDMLRVGRGLHELPGGAASKPEPPRVCRRLVDLSHAARAACLSWA